MTYVKTEWETGDIITAEKLNNMEDGIEECSTSIPNYQFVVHGMTDEGDAGYILDATWNELNSEVADNKLPIVVSIDPVLGARVDYLVGLFIDGGVYIATFINMGFRASDGDSALVLDI